MDIAKIILQYGYIFTGGKGLKSTRNELKTTNYWGYLITFFNRIILRR
jgi:hypothetical protein